jgi:hypothetical protein
VEEVWPLRQLLDASELVVVEEIHCLLWLSELTGRPTSWYCRKDSDSWEPDSIANWKRK